MWTKICGIRSVDDAQHAVHCGASAIGLNFHSPSPRCVSVDDGLHISGAVADSIETVGVFVNETTTEIARIVDEVGLDTIQLHGDEPPSVIGELRSRLPGTKVIRGWRVGSEGLAPLVDYLGTCVQTCGAPDAVLIDARVDGVWGGSGRTAPWQLVRDGYDRSRWPALILAGGLTPNNVAQAIHAVAPSGVDTASGVETSSGVKDAKLVRAFIAAARSVDG